MEDKAKTKQPEIKKKKHAGGRPAKFKPEYCEQAEKACAIFGADDVKLAEYFRVSKMTIENWKKRYPEFLYSVKRGKDVFDSENVEKSTLQRALGYEYEELHTEISDKDGEQKKVIKKIKKHVPADVTAGIFWNCNRNPERWKHVQRVEHSGPGGGPIESAVTIYLPDNGRDDDPENA